MQTFGDAGTTMGSVERRCTKICLVGKQERTLHSEMNTFMPHEDAMSAHSFLALLAWPYTW